MIMKKSFLGLLIFASMLAATQSAEDKPITGAPVNVVNIRQDGITVRLTYHRKGDKTPAKITWWCNEQRGQSGAYVVFHTYQWPDGQTQSCRYTHTETYHPWLQTVDDKGRLIEQAEIGVKINEPVEIDPKPLPPPGQ
jgi:hypothetical protein